MTDYKKHLYNLDELSDYKVAEGYPDVRGWDVKDLDNRVIGKVDNLLVNKDAERVVYLDVEVDKSIIDAKHDPYGRPNNTAIKEFINRDGENHVIIPIGLVDLNQDSNYVYTDKINHRTFAETKRYRKGDPIHREYENQVLKSYRRSEHSYETKDRNVGNMERENRIREIVREEIRKYHDIYGIDKKPYRDDVDDAVILSDEDTSVNRRNQNDAIYDDEHYYDRDEFNTERIRRKKM